MKVILVDHKDFASQKDFIGKEFKAPARYFKLVRQNRGRGRPRRR